MLHNAAESHRAFEPLLTRSIICCAGRWRAFRSFKALMAPTQRTAERIETSDNLTWTHCHGDCHGFNARISDAGNEAFFDFDDGGPGYLAYDLSVFLWAKVSFGRKLHAMWDAFVDGYRTVRPITAEDFEAAHAFVIVRHIWLIGEYASRAREWGSEPIDWIGRELEFLTSWEDGRLNGRLF